MHLNTEQERSDCTQESWNLNSALIWVFSLRFLCVLCVCGGICQ
jgi:hypothetical protein